jgi:hypothetical protein
MSPNRLPLRTFPAAAVCLVALWQWATVTANYRGNWTALFCTGAIQPQPPLAVSEHVYLFPNSAGYDGQFYHYMAHDPFLRSDLKTYIDDPRLRYRRILIPLLAYGLALGHAELIDPAYELVWLATVGLGVYWSCRLSQDAGLSAAWGLLFLAMPAIPIAMDRLVVDGGLAALTAAFLYLSRPSSSSSTWKLLVVLTCAALARETGFLLVLAYCAYLVWRREFRMAGAFLLSAVPAAAWYGYVGAQTTGRTYATSLIPFSGILRALWNPLRYPAKIQLAEAIRVADYLALAGMLLGIGLAFLWFARGPVDPPRIAATLFATLALLLQRTDLWQDVYGFGRIFTPLLLCLSAAAAEYRNPWLLAPVAMMLPRIAIEFAAQVLGVIRWMA